MIATYSDTIKNTSYYKDLEAKNLSLMEENDLLHEQIRLLKADRFGRKSEQFPWEQQPGLFDNQEPDVAEKDDAPDKDLEIKGYKRKRSRKNALPDSLPQVEKIIDLSEEEKTCHCGCLKRQFDREISKKLGFQPAVMWVINYIRLKYICDNCAQKDQPESGKKSITIAPAPKQLIPKSIVTPELLAHILASKFVDAMPFYRQEKQFRRLGVKISRTNMSNWLIKAAIKCSPF